VIEIEVSNFQSIKHASIQVQGFTALVGRSNIGKSAFVRAVRAALTGAPSTSFVRHFDGCPRKTKGAKTCKCYCSVRLRAKDFDLLWEKGDAINRYTFNGLVYDKAERGTPEFLQPAYAPVKIGDEKSLLQVADQFEPIFLLNQTGGVIADVLSDVANLDRVNVAIRLAEKDRREAVSTRKVREQDVVSLSDRLERFEGLDEALAKTLDVEAQLDRVEAAERNLAELDRYVERSSSLGRAVVRLEEMLCVEAPDKTSLRGSYDRCETLNRYVTHVAEREAALHVLEGIAKVTAPDPEALRSCSQRFHTLDVWIARLRVFKKLGENVKVLGNLPAMFPEALRTAYDAYERLDAKVRQYALLSGQVETLTRQLTDMEAEGHAIHKEWDAIDICPTCTQSFPEGKRPRVV
jgi:hypothetical protein